MVGTFLCSIALSQATTTLDFEDLYGTGNQYGSGPVPTNYAGLTWNNWVFYERYLPPWNAGSGQVRLFPQTTTATIEFGQDVTFVGVWLAGNAFGQYFEGYKNGIMIFESSHVANDGSNFGQSFTLNWTGVDEIRFQALSADATAFDDLEYNIVEPSPSPTPSPSPSPSPTPTPTPAYSAQVQQPINRDGSSVFNFRRGVIPVKFTLTLDGVATCALPQATIAVYRTGPGGNEPIDETLYAGSADNGSNFRIDSCQYVYNLGASALGVGTYQVDIMINGQIGSATFKLK